MKYILIIVAFIAALYFAFYNAKPKYQAEPKYTGVSYIKVYGRQSCSNTRRMVGFLQKQSLPFQYFSVDDKQVASKLHANMRKAGLDTRRYYLPVVEVNNQFFTNPDVEKIKSIYEHSNE